MKSYDKPLSIEKLRKLDDKNIDTSEIPPLDGHFWKNAKLIKGAGRKEPISLRLDKETLNWYRNQGKGYQKLMRQVLRTYYKAHKLLG